MDKITIERETLQQLYDELETVEYDADPPKRVLLLMDKLRAALAAQPAEPVANAPVAWLDEFGNVFPLGAWVRSEVREKWKPLYTEPAANAAQPAPAVVPPGYALVPDYRGYANLGTGQYLLNISNADDPPELIISIASESEKAGRTVGDLQDNQPGTVIEPEQMAVRLGFATEAGLAALEQHLRILREERFAAAGDNT